MGDLGTGGQEGGGQNIQEKWRPRKGTSPGFCGGKKVGSKKK